MLIAIANYGCRNRIFINTFNKPTNMAQGKLERPLGLKLILAYGVIYFILSLGSMITLGAGLVGFVFNIFFLFSLYGLWKMKKDWMYAFIFLVSISILVSILSIYTYSTFLIRSINIIFVTLHSISICWLYPNRNIFIEPEKGKSTRLVLIMLGVIAILFLAIILTYESMLNL